MSNPHSAAHWRRGVLFPQVVAGPIVRAGALLSQFAELRLFPVDARNAVLLCMVGYFKKVWSPD